MIRSLIPLNLQEEALPACGDVNFDLMFAAGEEKRVLRFDSLPVGGKGVDASCAEDDVRGGVLGIFEDEAEAGGGAGHAFDAGEAESWRFDPEADALRGAIALLVEDGGGDVTGGEIGDGRIDRD